MQNIHAFFSLRPTGVLFHYTDSVALMGIFENSELWASDVHHLNDFQEYHFAFQLVLNELRHREKSGVLVGEALRICRAIIGQSGTTPRNFEADCNVISLSENGDQLSQWRAYCPKGNGYAIGFSLDDLAYARKQYRALLVKCIYDPEEQHELVIAVADYLLKSRIRAAALGGWKELSFMLHAARKINAAMLAIKNTGFREENEWRLVIAPSKRSELKFRSGRFGILPYIALPLCEASLKPYFSKIIIGPTPEPLTTDSALQRFLAANARWRHGILPRLIENSSIPYRY